MKSRVIIVTDADRDGLNRLIRARQHSFSRDQQQLDLLDQLLQNADVRPLSRTPKTVVRMDSSVLARDCDTREEKRYTLVYPEDADLSRGLISVLAPVGIALLGHRKGDLVEASVPGGIRRLRVEEVREASRMVSKQFPKEQTINQELSLETDLVA